MKLWGGRFAKNNDHLMEDFHSSISFDKRLYKEDITGSLAHSKMLAKQGIISEEEGQLIAKALKEIHAEIESGEAEFDVAAEDIHMNVETMLIAKIGDVGKKLHTARSRNDQVALDDRLYLIKETDHIIDLLKEMEIPQDIEIGEAIFAAITTDTGNFQYSNTTRRCFEIMTELFDWGVDTNKVSVELYENIRLERKIIETMAFSTLNLLADGKAAVAYVTQEMLEKSGALSEETENVIRELRSIAGVEYAAFLKEKGPETVRLSLRAKTQGDVSAIAEKFGGGGHIKAAGATLNMTIEDAVNAVCAELERAAGAEYDRMEQGESETK